MFNSVGGQAGGWPPYPVVALCASAGGLGAFTTVLHGLPAAPGMAFVVVQHLDPQFKSQLVELLRKASSLPVVAVEDQMPVEVDRVHVIAPDTDLGVQGLTFRVTPRATSVSPVGIDRFLRSLAEDCGPRAVAVILSGTGSDGALGVQAVREAGGLTFAQAPVDAAFGGMPLSAIATGCVDIVRPAADLAGEIVRLAPMALAEDRNRGESRVAEGDAVPAELLDLLRAETAIDFKHYRQSTVRRRVCRRAALLEAGDMDRYLQHLRADSGEVHALVQDLLIHVTRFFRDPDVFGVLARSVFPDLIRRCPADGVVRMWVPGCSTGEEAYSLAIGFAEVADQLGSPVRCQVFATDVNEALLDRARRGIYLENIVDDVPTTRLSEFFERVGPSFRIVRRIRDACVFSRHDLLRDPPLSRIDLVSCRNVLIYLEQQRFVLARLHFALEPRGYLLLGRSESTMARADLFVPFERDARLFQSSDSVSRSIPLWPPDPRDARGRTPAAPILTAEDGASAYEELVATNEELQSLNEELESAKEEMEATNEELMTVNRELDGRNKAIQAAREFTQATLDTMRSPLAVLDHQMHVLLANRAFRRMFDRSPGSLEGQPLFGVELGLLDSPKLHAVLQDAARHRRPVDDIECECTLPGKGPRTLLVNVRHFEPDDRLLLSFEDVTVLRRLEADRRQAQKMEAIGHLAAGVAHDFNNLLTTLMFNGDLALANMPADTPARSHVEGMLVAGRQAGDLTHQLLAYAGKARVTLSRVDLGDVVRQTARLLHASIPPHIQIRLDLERDLPRLLADPSQMHQVVANLLSNAMEAIGEKSGTVLVRTTHQVIDVPAPSAIADMQELPPGGYLVLEVTDTGDGMSPEVQRQIFDPFFTTKFTGRGLGLAAVMGIVRSHDGGIEVNSVEGRGTTVRVRLPTHPTTPSLAEASAASPPRPAGTVLIIDDEENVTATVRRGLEWLGYPVVTATGGAVGVEVLRATPAVRLVLLDATMPGMNGRETLRHLRGVNPTVPVIVCSGGGDANVESAFADAGVVAFLHKPFSVRQLAREVATHMAEDPTGPTGASPTLPS